MENTEYPIGTKKATQIIGCAHRTIKEHCLFLKIKRLGKTGPYLINKNDLKLLKNDIKQSPGNPNFSKKK